jgi:hypothetical protein
MDFAPTPVGFVAIPRPAFGRAARHLRATPPPRVTRAEARYRRAAPTAAELLPELPRPGESVHALMTGTFDLCQVITAVAGRLPACRHLRVATLCLSRRNAADLLGLLDARPGLALTLLTSASFKRHNKDLYEWLAGELAAHPPPGWRPRGATARWCASTSGRATGWCSRGVPTSGPTATGSS